MVQICRMSLSNNKWRLTSGTDIDIAVTDIDDTGVTIDKSLIFFFLKNIFFKYLQAHLNNFMTLPKKHWNGVTSLRQPLCSLAWESTGISDLAGEAKIEHTKSKYTGQGIYSTQMWVVWMCFLLSAGTFVCFFFP